MDTQTSVHDLLESAFTFDWNERSRSTGISVHDPPERAGEGSFGSVIFGSKPSRTLSSGFLVPRVNFNNDEEASDTRIPMHGMDLRISRNAKGEILIRPSFNVYVRALPTPDELFLRGLRPKARLSPAGSTHLLDIKYAKVRARISDDVKGARRRELEEAIVRECYEEMGIRLPEKELIAQDLDVDRGEGAGDIVFQGARGEDLFIPDQWSADYDVPDKYVRLTVAPPELVLPLPYNDSIWQAMAEQHKRAMAAEIRRAYEVWIATEAGRLQAWRSRQVIRSSAFQTRASWQAELDRMRRAVPVPVLDELWPNMTVRMLIQPVIEPLAPDMVSVRIALENYQEGRAADSFEHGLFQVRLSISVPREALRFMPIERVKRSYHLSGFMRIPGMGVNGGVVHREEATFHLLGTTWMPRYVLPRMVPTSFATVPIAYEDLASEGTEVSRLQALPAEMRQWIADLKANPSLFEGDPDPSIDDKATEEARFQEDLAAWEREADRILLGVTLLERSQAEYRKDPQSELAWPFRAWGLTNLAFHKANKPDAGSPVPGWRLFQLGFLLSHLPTLASRIPGFSAPFTRRAPHQDANAHVAKMASEGRFFDALFDEESASLLYMTTGGGKSEAFFGVLTFGLFLDRLRGKERGITGMIHYPLRLLTLQQAQRLARLLAHAEIVRHDERLGGAPFEIGFWVGGGNTPNSITNGDAGSLNEDGKTIPAWDQAGRQDEDSLLKENRDYRASVEAWNKLPECPFCRARTVLRRYPEYRQRLGIVCTEEGRPEGDPDGRCPWNKRNKTTDRPEPLPFLLTDMDIYRRAPSVLLGTVDKLALIGNHPTTINRIAGMLGLAKFVDASGLLSSPTDPKDMAKVPCGTITVAPAYEDGNEIFKDPFPSVIIQDELHLLEESLGTFGGIFETGLFAWLGAIAPILGDRICRDPQGNPRLPHVVGATATASDVARQIDSIYRRNVVQFPHPGPKLYSSFYTRLASFQDGGEARRERATLARTPLEQEAAAPWARVYASLLTNGRLHTVATIAILSAYACGITMLLRDLVDPARQEAALDELKSNISDAPFAHRREAALERMRGLRSGYDALATLVDLHRIQLTYVTNKKGGDQILSALLRQAEKDHAAMGLAYEIGAKFDMELISGGVDVKTIQSVIKKAERLFDLGVGDICDTLRCIVATSAISHGVDVSLFNAMAFAGMPSDIAEYIQASSRVGRIHVGYSLLIPTPQSRRDRFVVEVHESFHRLLERMIAPPAIERWADKAIARTVPSLVQTYFAGILYQRQFCAAAGEDKGQVVFPSNVPSVRNEMEHQNQRGNWDTLLGSAAVDECVAFVRTAVGTEDGKVGPSTRHYRNLLKREVDRIVTEITSGKYGSDLMTFWSSHYHTLHRPMTSLRDVDEAGEIRAAFSTTKGKISLSRIGAAMAFVRNRRVGRASPGGATRTAAGGGSKDMATRPKRASGIADGGGETAQPKAPMPPSMMRSRGQLASVYAPGALFTFEGGKGACMAVSVRNDDADIGRTTEELIYEQIEELITSWVDRATLRTTGIALPIDIARAVDRAIVVGGQLSLGIDKFAFTTATEMGYVPFPLAFVCRGPRCGLHRVCRSVNSVEEDAAKFRNACPLGWENCEDDWEQLDVVMAHWSGDVQPLTPRRLRWDPVRGVQSRDVCINCGSDRFFLRRPSASFDDWHFECVSCRQGREIIVKDDFTFRLLGRELQQGGSAFGVEVNMEPISYRASAAYHVQSDRLLVFRDDQWLNMLKRNRGGDLVQFLGQQFGYPAAALTDAEKERMLRDKNKGSEWDTYVGTAKMLAQMRAAGMAVEQLSLLRAVLDKFEQDWEENVFTKRDRGSEVLRSRVDERVQWVRRYDPIRMAIEHKTLEQETLFNDAREVDGKPGCVNLKLLDVHLAPSDLRAEQEQQMLDAVELRLRLLGIDDMRLIRDLELCEYSFGFTRTSSLPLVNRQKGNAPVVDMPVRLNLFDRVGNPPRHPILCAKQANEALYVRLNERMVIRWLNENVLPVELGDPAVRLGGRLIEGYDPFSRFLDEYRAEGRIAREAYPFVYTLLHTMAHHLVGIVSELSGLDLGSFGEHLFVPNLAFLVYRRGTTMDLGNISSMWRNHSDRTIGNLVLDRMARRESLRCGSETVCHMRGGACPDCVMIPETACLTRNLLLSRSALIGGGFPEWDQARMSVRGFYDVVLEAEQEVTNPCAGAVAA